MNRRRLIAKRARQLRKQQRARQIVQLHSGDPDHIFDGFIQLEKGVRYTDFEVAFNAVPPRVRK